MQRLLLILFVCIAVQLPAQQYIVDSNFAVNGIGTYSSGGTGNNERATSMVSQGNGRYVIGGSSLGANRDNGFVRIKANGTLDSTFGTNGMFRTAVVTGVDEQVSNIAMLPDSSIIAQCQTTTGSIKPFLIKLTKNGSIDTTFNNGTGEWVSALSSSTHYFFGMAITNSGKIVCVGEDQEGSPDRLLMAMFNPNGTLDSTFGTNGVAKFAFGGTYHSGRNVRIDPAGKIVVVGQRNSSNSSVAGAILRFNPDGSLDSTFSNDGWLTVNSTTTQGIFFDVAFANNGDLLVTGYASTGNTNTDRIFLARYDNAGNAIQSFGTNGKKEIDLVPSLTDRGYRILPAGNNRYYLSFRAKRNSSVGSQDIYLMRILGNGEIDTTFGQGGVIYTDFDNLDNEMSAMAIRPSGEILVLGYTSNLSGSRFKLVQLKREPPKDPSFTLDSIVPSSLSTAMVYGAYSSSTPASLSLQFSSSLEFNTITILDSISLGNNLSTSKDSILSFTAQVNVNGFFGSQIFGRVIISTPARNDTSEVMMIHYDQDFNGPLDGMKVWVKANNGASFGLTSTWLNMVNGEAQKNIKKFSSVTMAESPSIAGSVISGKPVFRFDGLDDYLQSDNTLDIRKGYSIFIVARNKSRNNYNGIFRVANQATSNSDASDLEIYWQAGANSSTSGNIALVANRTGSGPVGGSYLSNNQGPSVNNNFYLLSYLVGDGETFQQATAKIDSINLPSNSSTLGPLNPANVNPAYIGLGYGKPLAGTNLHMDGDIAEIIVYDRKLDSLQSELVYEYLEIKYFGRQPTSVSSNLDLKSFKIYPNPTSSTFNIEFNGRVEGNMRVLDMTGKQMLQRSISARLEKVNLSKAPAGIYFVQISTSQGVETLKLVKE